MRGIIVAACAALVVVSGCATAPTGGSAPWSVVEGNCYTVDIEFTDISMEYVGPVDALGNVEFFSDQTCGSPTVVPGLHPIARAASEPAAVTACGGIDPTLVTVSNLSTDGWYLVSGSGSPGAPISADTWGCSDVVVP
jgi:hypothetical protein